MWKNVADARNGRRDLHTIWLADGASSHRPDIVNVQGGPIVSAGAVSPA